MQLFIFWALCLITLASAILVVFIRRPLHNVLFMVLTMIGLAGVFLQLHAEFVAMVQLIVYAGAVMVLFLFVIMLLNLDRLRVPNEMRAVRGWAGALIAFCVLGLLLAVFAAIGPAGAFPLASMEIAKANTAEIAKALFTTYLLPFEITSLLLLAAIIGTVILVKKT